MKKNLIVLCVLMNMFTLVSAQIRVMCTAALLDYEFELRKKQYIKCFEILNQYGYSNPYVVDAIKKVGPTFLEEHCANVFYAQSNNPQLKNKGINEASTMLEALKHFNFDPNDMVVKLTGRYLFMNDSFLRTLENNPDVDAIVRKMPLWGKELVVTGCYALRNHYMIDFIEQLDFKKMESQSIDIEWELKIYLEKIIKEKNAKVLYIDSLGLNAHVWGLNNNYGTYIW